MSWSTCLAARIEALVWYELEQRGAPGVPDDRLRKSRVSSQVWFRTWLRCGHSVQGRVDAPNPPEFTVITVA